MRIPNIASTKGSDARKNFELALISERCFLRIGRGDCDIVDGLAVLSLDCCGWGSAAGRDPNSTPLICLLALTPITSFPKNAVVDNYKGERSNEEEHKTETNKDYDDAYSTWYIEEKGEFAGLLLV
jgi:hypothetical protein